jgi:Flp pilus assembly protein TadG
MTRFSRHNPRRSNRRRGNAVMEAALVLPILLLLSFGTVEFGYFFYSKHTMQGAARDGARVAILPSSTNTAVTTAVAATMTAAGFASNEYTTTITNATTAATISNVGTVATGTAIKVQITAAWGTIGIRPVGTMGLFNVVWPLKTNTSVVGFTIMVKE